MQPRLRRAGKHISCHDIPSVTCNQDCACSSRAAVARISLNTHGRSPTKCSACTTSASKSSFRSVIPSVAAASYSTDCLSSTQRPSLARILFFPPLKPTARAACARLPIMCPVLPCPSAAVPAGCRAPALLCPCAAVSSCRSSCEWRWGRWCGDERVLGILLRKPRIDRSGLSNPTPTTPTHPQPSPLKTVGG